MDTATWDESNPEDIICVVRANGRVQTIHGRSVTEVEGRILSVMISEFRMSQADADAFATFAAEQRGKPTEMDDLRAQLTRAEAGLRQLAERNATLKGQLAAAQTDLAIALAEKKILGTSLEQATARIAEMHQSSMPAPETETDPPKGKT